jgi:hypothetical protein
LIKLIFVARKLLFAFLIISAVVYLSQRQAGQRGNEHSLHVCEGFGIVCAESESIRMKEIIDTSAFAETFGISHDAEGLASFGGDLVFENRYD